MVLDEDLRATHLLVSHLCHELVSPVGAINNGIELLEELGSNGMEKDALGLIAESGRNAAAKLRFYRLAYGNAGVAADFQPIQARAAAIELIGCDVRVRLDWPEGELRELPAGGAQLALNLLLAAVGALPRGGQIRLELPPEGIRISAQGTGARIPEPVMRMLEGNGKALDHSTIHAWLCARVATRTGCSIRVQSEPDLVRLLAPVG